MWQRTQPPRRTGGAQATRQPTQRIAHRAAPCAAPTGGRSTKHKTLWLRLVYGAYALRLPSLHVITLYITVRYGLVLTLHTIEHGTGHALSTKTALPPPLRTNSAKKEPGQCGPGRGRGGGILVKAGRGSSCVSVCTRRRTWRPCCSNRAGRPCPLAACTTLRPPPPQRRGRPCTSQ